MTPVSRSLPSLSGLPVEILMDIYLNLDLDSIFNISATSKPFQELYRERRVAILLPILRRDFSPFPELLQVYTARAEDIVGTQTYHARQVVFQRSIHDVGVPLDHHEIPALANPMAPRMKPTTSRRVLLNDGDIDPILDMCLITRQWERLFPQMRWVQEPANCRSLREHERFRFRRSFYRWWLYGTYFHGELPRPRIGLPEPLVEDIRTSQLRYYSTSELLELTDLLEAIKDLISNYICPRLDPVHDPDSIATDNVAVDEMPYPCPWDRIIATYAKLGPQELMHYFDNIYSYPRRRLITEIRLQRPNFTFDQESIQIALQCALTERRLWDQSPSPAEDSCGGIIDFDDERDEERVLFGSDASPDGTLPHGLKAIRSQSRYSPRGDDGSHLEDVYVARNIRTAGRAAVVQA